MISLREILAKDSKRNWLKRLFCRNSAQQDIPELPKGITLDTRTSFAIDGSKGKKYIFITYDGDTPQSYILIRDKLGSWKFYQHSEHDESRPRLISQLPERYTQILNSAY